jgi:anti-sigma factor RsiW
MTAYDDTRLESFLLDELPSPEREEIEQRIFADDDLFARVEELETDLLDAYAAGTLEAGLRDRLEASLPSCPARREKLLVAKLLRDKLPARGRQMPGRVIPFTRKHAWAFRLALAAALLAIAIGVPLLMQQADRQDATTQIAQEASAANDTTAPAAEPAQAAEEAAVTDSASATETPLVAIRRPAVPTVTNDTQQLSPDRLLRSTTLVLSTISLRSGTGLRALELTDDLGTVTIQLMLESDEYSSYNVDIRNTGGTSVWNGIRIPLTTVDGGPAVAFDVPAEVFSAGRHELVLAGVEETHAEEVAYVDFEVLPRR